MVLNTLYFFLLSALRFHTSIVNMFRVTVLYFGGGGWKGVEAIQCTACMLSVDVQRPIGFRFRLLEAQILCP